MYKVLIVDDEVLVRVGLKTTIDWEAIGFTIVAEASNGEQGYENYLKHRPDVIITDIKMPKQDGLWLVDKIRKDNAEAKILVLTCFNEFSYARTALKVGADDYILKSEIEDEELIKLMGNIKEKIDQQCRARIGKDNNVTYLEDVKRSIFSDLVEKGFSMEERMLKSLQELNFPTSNTFFAFMSISVIHNIDTQISTQTNTGQVNNAVLNLIFDQLNQNSIHYINGEQANKYLFFMSSSKPMEIKKIFYSIGNGARQYFDISINAVYSRVFEHIEQAGNLYKEYHEKAQILFYKSKNNTILQMDKITFSEPNVVDLKKENNKQLIEAVGQENPEKVRGIIDETGQYFEQGKVSPKIVKIFYSNMMWDLFSSYGLFLSNREVFDTHQTYHYKIELSDQLENIIKLLINFSTSLIAEIQNMRYNNSKLMINQALNFIEYHYAEKISLEDVAKELNLSKHYLCSVFKKETGENMSLYINKLRIGKAKQILLESDSKIKEVYERVGYSNQQYFSKVFKKITGLTVIEYKEGMGKKLK